MTAKNPAAFGLIYLEKVLGVLVLISAGIVIAEFGTVAVGGDSSHGDAGSVSFAKILVGKSMSDGCLEWH